MRRDIYDPSTEDRVYGIVVEIYHPDSRAPEVNGVDRMQEAPTVGALLEQGVSLDEIWKRIESGSPYDRSDARYNRAFRVSRRQVFHAEEQIDALLCSEPDGTVPDRSPGKDVSFRG